MTRLTNQNSKQLLTSGDFNFANLEKEYFAGLKFGDFDKSPFFKVIKFRESNNASFAD